MRSYPNLATNSANKFSSPFLSGIASGHCGPHKPEGARCHHRARSTSRGGVATAISQHAARIIYLASTLQRPPPPPPPPRAALPPSGRPRAATCSTICTRCPLPDPGSPPKLRSHHPLGVLGRGDDALSTHAIRGDLGHWMLRKRIATQSEVIWAIVLEDSPCCGGPAPAS